MLVLYSTYKNHTFVSHHVKFNGTLAVVHQLTSSNRNISHARHLFFSKIKVNLTESHVLQATYHHTEFQNYLLFPIQNWAWNQYFTQFRFGL